MVFSFAMDRTGACLPLGLCAIPPNSCNGASFPINLQRNAAIFSTRGNVLEPIEATSVCYPGTVAAAKIRADSPLSLSSPGDIQMVITAAHISPIIALIAGILILIMPRLLNLVVAIYLICIGLIGLGVLKWLHM
jgi:hypothetical protein